MYEGNTFTCISLTEINEVFMMFAMGKYKVGDEVDIVVLRNGAEEKLKVKMGSR
jgi:hypothetical protein